MPPKEGKGIHDEAIDAEDRSSLSPSSHGMQTPSKHKQQLLHRGRPPSSAGSQSKGRDSQLLRPGGFELRRAILIGRRGGPSTPVPSWKLTDSSIVDPSFEHHLHHSRHRHHLQHAHQGQGLVISARKLAASLWELQDQSSFSKSVQTYAQANVPHQEASSTEQHYMQDGQHHSPALSHSGEGCKNKSLIHTKSRRKGKAHGKLDKCREHQILPDYIRENTANGRHVLTPKSMVLSSKGILSNLSCGPTTAGDLLKILNHVWHLEEQNASNMSLVGTLRVELEEARCQLQELLLSEKNFCKEAKNISTRIAEERALRQERQEQYVMVAVQSVMQDLEKEQKSKRKLESLHKKVAKEFRHARKSLLAALENLERERKARKLMEEVCDELAIEIGQDKARVEELKLESAKVRQEAEEERKMLQMAEIWREERVHMKLMEAKLELEEKNTALNKLRSQLEAFLKAKRAGGSANDRTGHTNPDSSGHSLDIVIGNNLTDSFHSKEIQGMHSSSYSLDSGGDQQAGKQNAWLSFSDDDDDLHSIELNREPLMRTASSNLRQKSFEHCEKENVQIGLSDDSISTSDSDEHRARSFQGVETLETPKYDHFSGTRAEDSAQGSVPQSCRWREPTVGGGEMKEWRKGQEGNLQQWSRSSGVEEYQTLIFASPGAAIRSNKMRAKSAFRVSSTTRRWNRYFDWRSKAT